MFPTNPPWLTIRGRGSMQAISALTNQAIKICSCPECLRLRRETPATVVLLEYAEFTSSCQDHSKPAAASISIRAGNQVILLQMSYNHDSCSAIPNNFLSPLVCGKKLHPQHTLCHPHSRRTTFLGGSRRVLTRPRGRKQDLPSRGRSSPRPLDRGSTEAGGAGTVRVQSVRAGGRGLGGGACASRRTTLSRRFRPAFRISQPEIHGHISPGSTLPTPPRAPCILAP